MRQFFGTALILAVCLPSVLAAQGRRQHELGMDVGVSYTKPSDVDGGISIATPLDLRLGLPARGKVMWEPRLSFALSTVGGETTYGITPGLNILYATTPKGHRTGMYVTGGAGLLLADTGNETGTALSMNGAVGWRKPWGTGAWRYELGFRYVFENEGLGLPSTVQIGARIGVSLWK